MPAPASFSRTVRVGVFQIDLQSREVRKNGRTLKLQEQPFRVLEVLLEKPGEVVSREELQKRIWPEDTYVGFDDGLNTAIRKLRIAFDDFPENPRFIETIPRRGYRFIAPVAREENGQAAIAGPGRGNGTAAAHLQVAVENAESVESTQLQEVPQRRWRFRLLAAGLLLCASAIAAWKLRPSLPPPRVARVRQLTHLGNVLPFIISDGPRIYFMPEEFPPRNIYHSISIEGGESTVAKELGPGLSPDWNLLSFSPDSAQALVRTGYGPEYHRWKVSLPSGAMQAFDSVPLGYPVWSPDGNSIVSVDDENLYTMNSDGSHLRKLASFAGSSEEPSRPAWSPDGRRIRLTLYKFAGDSLVGRRIIEVDVASGAARPVPLNRVSPRAVGWLGNGDYFLFASREGEVGTIWGGVSNLWVVRDHRPWFRTANDQPTRLTEGALSFDFPVIGKDGKTIFAVGSNFRAEAQRFDRKSEKYAPFLGGRPADHISFSRDGRWVAYVSYPDRNLWRCRADGTDCLQLTFPPLRTALPSWSPDGKHIAFHASTEGKVFKGYIISTEGGTPEPLLPNGAAGEESLSWSPDGKQILYHEVSPSSARRMRIVNLNSKGITDVPDSTGLVGMWSPDGRYIAAAESSTRELRIFDFQTGRWTNLAPLRGSVRWGPSPDYFYFNTVDIGPLSPGAAVMFRVRIRDKHVEEVLRMPDIRLTGVWGITPSVAPDGSPVVLKDMSTADLYALDLDLP